MSVTRDFDAMVADKAGQRPTFRIAGQQFTLRSRLPFRKWNDLLAMMRDDETDNLAATRQFFNTCLIKADRERFAALLDSEDDENDDLVIGLDQMNDLTDWVMEHFTGKPLSSGSGSTPGAGATGQRPNVVSLNARSTAG